MAFSDTKIGIIVAVIGALGSGVAILTFMENRKDKALKDEMLKIDKEIKILELAYKRKRNSDLDLNKPHLDLNKPQKTIEL